LITPESEFKNLFDILNIKFDKSFLKLEEINRPVKTASFLQINNKLEKIQRPEWIKFEKKYPYFSKIII
jgi:hypothetical protein